MEAIDPTISADMTILDELSLAWDIPGIGPDAISFRPPSWPPPANWPVSLDEKLRPVSYYGDDIWDFTFWAGRAFRLNFVGGQKGSRALLINAENAELLRLVTAWFIWGKFAASTTSTLMYYFNTIRSLFVLASENRIRGDQIMRFPRVFQALKRLHAEKKNEHLPLLLHRLWDSREELGFVLVDSAGIQELVELGASHDRNQTPYIPPRIWAYQVGRIRECLEDYLAKKSQIENCFNYCVDAYASMHGTLEAAMVSARTVSPTMKPFAIQSKNVDQSNEQIYPGRFEKTANLFGLMDLLDKWIGASSVAGREIGVIVSDLSQYLSLCQRAAYAYIMNFTVQRKGEAASLRADCLIWEQDPLGAIPVICGETTKTDIDSDARWPTSPSVSLAIEVATSIALLRMRCAAAHPEVQTTEIDQSNPYLFHRVFEPFGLATDRSVRYATLPQQVSYQRALEYYPRLLDPNELRITAEDRRIALMFTPWLEHDDAFSVGEVWPLAWHQLRRTGAVNMFSSELLSDSSIQFLMKHRSQSMSRYYGRGRGRLRVSEVATKLVVSSMYEVRVEASKSLATEKYVSPLGFERKQGALVHLVDKKDAKALAKAGRNGNVGFRFIRLGACTSQEDCEYGGIESVARCGGGDSGKPCSDALFDREKEGTVIDELRELEQELAASVAGTPKYKALIAERSAMENYLNVLAGLT